MRLLRWKKILIETSDLSQFQMKLNILMHRSVRGITFVVGPITRNKCKGRREAVRPKGRASCISAGTFLPSSKFQLRTERSFPPKVSLSQRPWTYFVLFLVEKSRPLAQA